MGKKLRVGLVQQAWHPDPVKHCENLAAGIQKAARQGAEIVCLQELTLSPYFCTQANRDGRQWMEDPDSGPTASFARAMALEHQVCISASLFEKSGHNTAIAFDKNGRCLGLTRKQHIPSGQGYHEDHYFQPGDSNYPVYTLAGHQAGLPTCYDQWFPELSRIYGLKGAEMLVYPTAIGAEPTAPGFDSQPAWQTVIRAQGIMANCFMIVINRTGTEDGLRFYGSSFISSPLGEILAEAPRDEPAILVAELDFSQRDLWGRLFPFAQQRRPETYQLLMRNFSEKTR